MYRVINFTTNQVYGDFLARESATDEAENQHERHRQQLVAVIDSDIDAIVELYADGRQVF